MLKIPHGIHGFSKAVKRATHQIHSLTTGPIFGNRLRTHAGEIYPTGKNLARKTSIFLTFPADLPENIGVITVKPDRPYFDAWLRRTKRRFAVSGRLSQVAMVLANENGGTSDEWRERLRIFLNGKESPSLELLTRIDALLSGPPPTRVADDAQCSLFP
jgi:hypothetical protein